MLDTKRLLWMGLAACSLWGAAHAQQIYRCTDAHGRKLTSDRPIPECADRSQQLVKTNGVVQTLAPMASAAELTIQEERMRQVNQALHAEKEATRRDVALKARYPSQTSFDQQRATALAPMEERVQMTQRRIAEMTVRHDAMVRQERPRSDIEFMAQQIRYQGSMLRAYQEELRQANAQFDQWQQRLRNLWAEDNALAAARIR